MARVNGSGFKMKSSPTKKGLFSNLFSSLGAKKTDIGGEMKKKYSGKAQRANEVPRSGESKYQFDVRTRKPKKGVPQEIVSETTVPETTPGQETVSEIVESKAYVPQEFKGEAGDKFRYRQTGDYGEKQEFEFMDPSRPGKWIPAQSVDGSWAGWNRIQELFGKRQDADELFDSPVEKKSPYKKGLGSYAKQAKGSRGYKMKRK